MFDFFVEILKGIASMFIYSWWIFAIILGIFAFQNRRKTEWVRSKENVVLEIKIPKTNDKNPTAAEMMFATLHGILKPKIEVLKEGSIQEHISFEIVADHSSIRFYVWTPKHLKDFIEGQIYAQYPSADINVTEDYSLRYNEEDVKEKTLHLKGTEIVLEKEDFLPIKTFNNFQVDPLAGITGVLSKLEEKGEEIWIQILARPVSDEWKQAGLNWIKKKRGGGPDFDFENFGKFLLSLPIELVKAFLFGPGEVKDKKDKLSAEEEGKISAIEQKSEKLGYDVKLRAIYLSPTGESENQKIQAILGAFKQYNTTNLNGFKGHNVHNKAEFLNEYQNRIFMEGGYHLNIEELASIYHLPHTSVETPNINWTTSKTGEPPTEIPTPENTGAEDLTLFGETNFRGSRQVFGIKRDDRRRHMYVIGKSGMGKTKLLENLANNDIKKGEGVAIIDPHGDYIHDVLKKIPQERIKDVIIFDPSDQAHPIAFNPMEVIDENLKVQIAAGVVRTFKKIFGFSWGPRLEHILNYTVLALLDTEGSTLLGVVRMLTDKNFRKNIVANIKDPVVKKFWTTEFASYTDKFANEAIAPILNKVGQFVANSLIRNVIGQPHSSFSMRKAMDEGKIVLINLSTGRLGETNASLLGSLMITNIQLAAMSRADIPENERRDFYLYVDEFQNFATESFSVILSEARKYRLNLIMANQYIQQMDEVVREAVFGNVGTMITFRVGAGDASVLQKEFNPPFTDQDLINLPRQNIYARMTINGQSEQAFSAKTLTVTEESTNVVNEIIEHSRKNYTKPKEEVEIDVARVAGIELESPTGAEITSEIKETLAVASEALKQNEDPAEFQAPIVKSLKGGKKKIDKSSQADAIKEAIKEGTASLKPAEPKKDLSRAVNPEQSRGESGDEPKQEPATKEADVAQLKIKDKIDKDTLSEILKKVVTPIEGGKTESKPAAEKDKKEIKTTKIPASEPKEVEDGNLIIKEIPNPVIKNQIENRGEEKKEAPKTIVKENRTSPAPQVAEQSMPKPHHNKTEKIITPQNFKEIKEIHPHEIVKIVSEPKALEEGEEIKFE